jgi:preprotein translocase subunit SecG
MILTAIFLILIVLIQRGRGGGLAGAFGGMGGQSAFGTKAGDLFTRITIGVAAFWIVLCIVTAKLTINRSDRFDPTLGRASGGAPTTSTQTDAGGTGGTTPSATTTPGASDSGKTGGASTSAAGNTAAGNTAAGNTAAGNTTESPNGGRPVGDSGSKGSENNAASK